MLVNENRSRRAGDSLCGRRNLGHPHPFRRTDLRVTQRIPTARARQTITGYGDHRRVTGYVGNRLGDVCPGGTQRGRCKRLISADLQGQVWARAKRDARRNCEGSRVDGAAAAASGETPYQKNNKKSTKNRKTRNAGPTHSSSPPSRLPTRRATPL